MQLKNLIDIAKVQEIGDFVWYGSADCSKVDFLHQDIDASLRKMAGSFAIVREDNSSIILICDFIRSIPLFYCVYKDEIVIGNNGVTVAKYCHATFSETARTEFLYTSYVTGNETLFQSVYSVLPGEIVRISKSDGTINRHFYWEMIYEGKMEKLSESELINKFDDCLTEVFKDLIARLDGRTALIPLSGGCDSRIVAAMFKRLNYEKVICFSYGRRGNNDAVVSKKVANALGFPWHFIEYNKDMWENLYTSEVYGDYLSYSCNGSGIGSVRSFPAMMKLKDKIPNDCIVVPGHTLDVSFGSHIPDWKDAQVISRNEFVKQIKMKHYRLRRYPILCDSIVNRWADSLPQEMNEKRAIQEIQYFEWINRQPKFIANEVRKYEFLGYGGWELPFWDYRVCEFVREVPAHMLKERYLQYKYMEKIIDPVVGIQIDYFKLLGGSEKAANIKRNLLRMFPFPARAYCLFKMYKHDPMAFYDHITLVEYINWIRRCGVGFNVHAMTTENGLHKIEEIINQD
ncbi:MAG: hypothetical protein HDR03_07045 [Lachnospiraceae bacterium]|nr:hypothetical protein [Lachnospiraceae bacterium]